jgi:threonine dehydrogenase-like Zn-dependent dehydrogenase
MKAITFDLSIPRYFLGKSLGGLTSAVTYGALSGVKLKDLPEPVLPGPKWVRLEVLAAGICGTDLSTLTFAGSPLMEPFASFPAVLGHEVLARVAEVGPEVRRVEVGQRVAVEPLLSCETRGIDAEASCPSCRRGRPATCTQAGEAGPLTVNGNLLAPGVTIGYHRDLPGGWGEAMVAHEAQLYPVPDDMEDGTAVLFEPLSIGVHAALNSPPFPHEPVLVIGSGPIAMSTLWALRATGFGGTLVAQAKRFKEGRLALALGATEVVKPGVGAREALVDTGAKAYMPLVGPEVYAGGGFPLIYDCVGSRESLEQALRYAAPRGRIVMLGCSAQLRRVDLTFLWARELEVVGYFGYGRERWRGGEAHTFEITRELLQETSAPVGRMVTHVFPMDQYRDALRAASNRRVSGAMKVVMTPVR